MDVDEALAREAPLGIRRRLADDADQGTAGIALDAEDRVSDEVRGQTLLGEFGQGRIEEEWAVVVDDFEDRHLASAAVPHQVDIRKTHPRRIIGAPGLGQERAGPGGEIREVAGGVGRQILRGHAAEQVAHESARSSLSGDDVGGRLNQPGAGRFLLR